MRPSQAIIGYAFSGFQFTHPGKGATGFSSQQRQADEVSIHAPWEGCDSIMFLARWSTIMFQFTHPGKGATLPQATQGCRAEVSIHAPWEGCDLGGLIKVEELTKFQFTHPGKGATDL